MATSMSPTIDEDRKYNECQKCQRQWKPKERRNGMLCRNCKKVRKYKDRPGRFEIAEDLENWRTWPCLEDDESNFVGNGSQDGV